MFSVISYLIFLQLYEWNENSLRTEWYWCYKSSGPYSLLDLLISFIPRSLFITLNKLSSFSDMNNFFLEKRSFLLAIEYLFLTSWEKSFTGIQPCMTRMLLHLTGFLFLYSIILLVILIYLKEEHFFFCFLF